MARWRLSTRGNESPAVGGDYIRDSFHTNHTHVSSGLNDLIGNNYKLRDEVQALEQSAWASRDRLAERERTLQVWRMIAIVCAVLLLVSFGLWKVRPTRVKTKIAPASNAAETTTPLEPEPVATPPVPVVSLAPPKCNAGKWITMFASAQPGDELGDLVQVAADLTERAPLPLDIKYASTDSPETCGTLKPGFIIVYVGPLDSPQEAARLCQQLGWKTESADDLKHCRGKALDKTLELQTILPSGRMIRR